MPQVESEAEKKYWLDVLHQQERSYEPDRTSAEVHFGRKTLFTGPVFRANFYGTTLFNSLFPPDYRDGTSKKGMFVSQASMMGGKPDNLYLLMVTQPQGDQISLDVVHPFVSLNAQNVVYGARTLAAIDVFFQTFPGKMNEFNFLRRGFPMELFFGFQWALGNALRDYPDDQLTPGDLEERYRFNWVSLRNSLDQRVIHQEDVRLRSLLRFT